MKERPLCRRAIEKFQLRPTDSKYRALRPDGTTTSLSDGMRKQMAKMIAEGYWPDIAYEGTDQWATDRCAVCLTPIAKGESVTDWTVNLRYHDGACNAVVQSLHRVFDRSPRGRYRSRRDILRLLAERRRQTATEDSL